MALDERFTDEDWSVMGDFLAAHPTPTPEPTDVHWVRNLWPRLKAWRPRWPHIPERDDFENPVERKGKK